MPAPRTCRSCGAAIATRRCPRCGIEVTEFASRVPLHEGGYVGDPVPDVHTSRWRASPTTFGPVGRLTVTASVFLFPAGGLTMTGGLLSPFGLWFALAWSIVAGFVFRQTWAPVRIGAPAGMRSRIARRYPRLGGSIPPRMLTAIALLGVVGVAGYGWTSGDTVARFGVVVAGVMILAVALLIWLSDS
jgi:hypothetical protein